MNDLEEALFVAYNTILKQIFLDKFIDAYMKAFSVAYDKYIDIPDANDFDMTSPKHIKDEVLEYVRSSLFDAIMKIDPRKGVAFNAVDDDVFSSPPDKKEQGGLKLFYFYIAGTPGRYVAFTTDLFNKLFPGRRVGNLDFGRFGNMFLMEASKYENMYNKLNGKDRGWPTSDQIEHPFSGHGAVRIFQKVKVDIKPFLEMAEISLVKKLKSGM